VRQQLCDIDRHIGKLCDVLADGVAQIEGAFVPKSHHRDGHECLRYRSDPVLGVRCRRIDADKPRGASASPPKEKTVSHDSGHHRRRATGRLLALEATVEFALQVVGKPCGPCRAVGSKLAR
jgi:hypothetical protein